MSRPGLSVVLALQGHEYPVGRAERIQGQKAERGWGIDDDEVVVRGGQAQGIAQLHLPAGQRDQFDFRAGQILARGHELEEGQLGGAGDIGDALVPDEHVIDAAAVAAGRLARMA